MATWPVGAGGPTNPYSGKPSSTVKITSGGFGSGMTSTWIPMPVTSGHYPFGNEPNREFSERPFLVGSLTGIRCFSVDRLGRLGPINTFPNSWWKPGENIGECHRNWQMQQYFDVYGSPDLYTINTLLQMAGKPAISASVGDRITEPMYREILEACKLPDHRVAATDCSCGFYAYYDDDDNPHHRQGFLYGVIEGYGVMTVGTRGFRCSKAQIKALVIPAKRSIAWTKVAANYSSIPVFETESEALKKFPLSLPSDIPSPDNTDDFWTKEA